jgi:tRNA (cytidine/uridine-2'-O-)-methyltransferase
MEVPVLKIVLYQPEIPANTGNIGRLCLGTGTELHIIRPMRFLITDKALQRAGLDYWHHLNVHFYDSLDELLAKFPDSVPFCCTTKADRFYTDVSYRPGDMLIFGPESRGLPADVLSAHADSCVTIPMTGAIRSLNLANSVSIVLYEALRQTGFPHMSGFTKRMEKNEPLLSNE